jgi:spermidine synthase
MATHRIYYIDEDDGYVDAILTDPKKYIEQISKSGIEAVIMDLEADEESKIITEQTAQFFRDIRNAIKDPGISIEEFQDICRNFELFMMINPLAVGKVFNSSALPLKGFTNILDLIGERNANLRV